MPTAHAPTTYIILAPCRPWVGFSRSDGVYVKQPPEPLVFTTPVWSQRLHEASNRYNHTRYSIAEMNGQYGPHGYHSDRADLANTMSDVQPIYQHQVNVPFDPRVPSWTSCQSYRPHYDHRIAEAGCPELQMQIGLGSSQARSRPDQQQPQPFLNHQQNLQPLHHTVLSSPAVRHIHNPRATIPSCNTSCNASKSQSFSPVMEEHTVSHPTSSSKSASVKSSPPASLRNTVIVPTPERKGYSCTWPNCDKKFKSKWHWTSHMNSHSNVRKFSCEKCTMKFVRRHDLLMHSRSYHGIYVCKECGWKVDANDEAALKEHLISCKQ